VKSKEATPSGHELQLSDEVIYLGLTLDREWTWKPQLKDMMNEVYRAFWTCKGTF
jgi:hypothetical protein